MIESSQLFRAGFSRFWVKSGRADPAASSVLLAGFRVPPVQSQAMREIFPRSSAHDRLAPHASAQVLLATAQVRGIFGTGGLCDVAADLEHALNARLTRSPASSSPLRQACPFFTRRGWKRGRRKSTHAVSVPSGTSAMSF